MKKIIKILSSPITYRLSLDVLAILLFIFLGFIAGEIILPGILGNYISLGELTGVLFVMIGIITILAREQEISFDYKIINRYFFIFGCTVVTSLTFVSLLKFGIIIDLFLTAISTTLFVLIHKYFFEELEKN
ncbi:MAG: hypothetical protein KAT32_03140 [Candidatus Moranbacteria bacterium]|nr:hypothetical protein [Candidatus Moranbacteria bacterium]